MNHTGEKRPSAASVSTTRRRRGSGAPPDSTRDDRLAACVGPHGRWFFSEDALQIQQAKKLCSMCFRQADCLAGALERREPWGVWGGQLLHKGVVVSSLPVRGRPRSTRPARQVGGSR